MGVVLAAHRVRGAIARESGQYRMARSESTVDLPRATTDTNDGDRRAGEADDDVGAEDDVKQPENDAREGVVRADNGVAALHGTGRASTARRAGGGGPLRGCKHGHISKRLWYEKDDDTSRE